DLDDALRRLEAEDPRKAEVVNLRFFAGLTVDQIAACTGMSKATIERDWAYAREWLKRDLRKSVGDESA
ncbi:MAG: ECF-type sigma factor, partial [Planctomycetota bacterium]